MFNQDGTSYYLQVRLIYAQIFDIAQLEEDPLFTLTIVSFHHNYNTPAYQLHHDKIDLTSCSPIQITFIPQQSFKKFASLIKISINSCSNDGSYQTSVEIKTINSLIEQNKSTILGKNKNISVLGFPLYRANKVKGELKMSIKFIKKEHQASHIASPGSPSSSSLTNAKTFLRKIVFSKNQSEYFKPCLSRIISISTASIESQENIQESHKQSKDQKNQNAVREQACQIGSEKCEKTAKMLGFEPFKQEQISLIELRDSNEDKLMTEQELDQMTELAFNRELDPRRVTQNIHLGENNQNDEIEEVPQSCCHLFQKINQINMKYAPLERIPSQQQLSQSYVSDGTALSFQQMHRPLDEAEYLLKQLNLFAYGQKLCKDMARPSDVININ